MSQLYDVITRHGEHAPRDKAFTYRVGEVYESVDYATLCSYVNSLSARLADHAGQTIAIIGNNKLEYAVSLLATLGCIGDAFLIDKELKEEDVLKIFGQRKPELVILDEDLELELNGYAIMGFRDVCEAMKEGLAFKPRASFSGHLLLHTSGTTGEPKCVSLSEENYFGVIPELNEKWEVTAEQSCLLIIPLYHVYALTSLFHGLYAGINNILEWDFRRLANVLEQTKPHLFMGVPLIYNKIRDAILEKAGAKIKLATWCSDVLLKLKIDVRRKWFSEIHKYFGGNYVFGVSAGSLLPRETSRFFQSVGLPIYNVYGMTETSGPIAINYKGHNRLDSVGEVLRINEVMIGNADENGVGRVCVKGSNMFQGYLNEKDEPSSGDYFYTGDLGYVKDGYLYVIGRERNVLIGANGKNVSPEELNRKILKHNDVHDCNVIMENDRLIAIVNTDLSEAELRAYVDKVNEKLPRYKRISEIRMTKEKIK